MSPAPLAELPPEVLDCIAHAALIAEDSDLSAWVRLSHVCNSWRDSLRGARDLCGCFDAIPADKLTRSHRAVDPSSCSCPMHALRIASIIVCGSGPTRQSATFAGRPSLSTVVQAHRLC